MELIIIQPQVHQETLILARYSAMLGVLEEDKHQEAMIFLTI